MGHFFPADHDDRGVDEVRIVAHADDIAGGTLPEQLARLAECDGDAVTVSDMRRVLGIPAGVGLSLPSPDLTANRDAGQRWSKRRIERWLRGESGGKDFRGVTFR